MDLSANMDKLPLYKKYLDSAQDSLESLYSSDGRLYGFYSVQAGWQNYSGGSNELLYGTAVRKDILDKNGLEVPQTVDVNEGIAPSHYLSDLGDALVFNDIPQCSFICAFHF